MDRKTFEDIIELDYNKFDFKNSKDIIGVGIPSDKTGRFLRVHYNTNLDGILNKKLSLDILLEFNKKTQDVEMEILRGNLKIQEGFIVNLLSEKALEDMRANILLQLENYLDNGTCNTVFNNI